MNSRLFLTIAAVALVTMLPAEAQGARRKGPPGRATAADPFASSETAPARQLAPYIEHIEQLLALERAPVFDQAPGKLALLKHSFTDRRKTAEGPEKNALDAAIRTCDRLTAALDERKKTAAQIAASSTVRGSDDLGERRKDSLVKNIRPGIGRGRAAEVEGRRERAEKAELRREAAQTDNSMTARSIQRWKERSTDLRKQITESYSRIPAA